MAEIVQTEDVLGGKPRLEGRRVSVLRVAELAQEESPEYVADQLGLSLAEVHTALAYYYEHIEEMRELRERRARRDEELRESVETVTPSDIASDQQ